MELFDNAMRDEVPFKLARHVNTSDDLTNVSGYTDGNLGEHGYEDPEEISVHAEEPTDDPEYLDGQFPGEEDAGDSQDGTVNDTDGNSLPSPSPDDPPTSTGSQRFEFVITFQNGSGQITAGTDEGTQQGPELSDDDDGSSDEDLLPATGTMQFLKPKYPERRTGPDFDDMADLDEVMVDVSYTGMQGPVEEMRKELCTGLKGCLQLALDILDNVF